MKQHFLMQEEERKNLEGVIPKRLRLYSERAVVPTCAGGGLKLFLIIIRHVGKSYHRVFGTYKVAQLPKRKNLDIQLFFVRESELVAWLVSQRGTKKTMQRFPDNLLTIPERSITGKFEFYPPTDGHYYLVLDNRHSVHTPKGVDIEVFEEWSELAETAEYVVTTVPPSDRSLLEEVLRMIREARTDLMIVTPYIDMTVLNELLDKIADGTKVLVVTRKREEFKGKEKIATFDVLNSRLGEGHTVNQFVHARVVIKDQQEVLISSADLSHDSLVGLYNAGIVSSNPKIVGRMVDFFRKVRAKT